MRARRCASCGWLGPRAGEGGCSGWAQRFFSSVQRAACTQDAPAVSCTRATPTPPAWVAAAVSASSCAASEATPRQTCWADKRGACVMITTAPGRLLGTEVGRRGASGLLGGDECHRTLPDCWFLMQCKTDWSFTECNQVAARAHLRAAAHLEPRRGCCQLAETLCNAAMRASVLLRDRVEAQ